MFKFEMVIGWMGDGKVSIETNDFDVIEILKDFIEFQQEEGWLQCYEFSAIDHEEEDDSSDETTVVQ